MSNKDQELYEELLANIDQVLFVRDAHSHVLYVNEAYERNWGLTRESLYKDPYSFLEVVYPDDRQAIVDAYGDIGITKRELSIDFRVVDVEGKVKWLYARVYPLKDANGNVTRLLGITDDITERKERELRISKMNELQDDIIEMLAHDLRTPISGIKFLAELINKQECEKLDYRHSNQIIESCDDTLRLMDDLLSHIQVNSKGLKLNQSNFILEEQIQIVCDLFMERIAFKELKLILPKSRTKVRLDQLRFHQIMTNLISNAIKFNNKKGEVSVSIIKENGQLTITVADTGIGIPESLQPEVFDLFSSSGRVGTYGEKSTGLGLSITKRLVKLHNGDLIMKSKEGEGTQMMLKFPLA